MSIIRHSVVIPTFNHAKYIGRSLQSALSQAGEDTEIIVVDDGSTDDTRLRVEAFVGPITYVSTTNHGPGAARNRGVRESRGEFVLFLDADDALLDGALEMLRQSQRHLQSVDMFCGGYVSIDRGGRLKQRPLPRLGHLRNRNFRACISGSLELQIGATAIRRRLLKDLPFPENVHHGEDIVLFAQLLAQADCRAVGARLVAKFDHAGRLRNDTAGLISSGLDAVDLLFNPNRLPTPLMQYRHVFAARQLLTLARAHYQRHEYAQAVACYHRAIALRPANILRWSYFRKYCRALPRAWTDCRLQTTSPVMGNSETRTTLT